MTMRFRSRKTLLASAALAAGALGITAAVAQQGGGSSSAAHIPNQPHNVAEYVQTTAAGTPAPGAPSPLGTLPPGEGRLAKLNASLDTRGWTVVSRPDFPISAKMPPGYFANFRVFNMLDGSQGYELRFTNFDLKADQTAARDEGAPPIPKRVGITAQLYPSGPGPIGDAAGQVTDRVTVVAPGLKNAGIELRQRHAQPQIGPAQDVVDGVTQVAVSGGRYLVLSASADTDDHLVQNMIGILASMEVK